MVAMLHSHKGAHKGEIIFVIGVTDLKRKECVHPSLIINNSSPSESWRKPTPPWPKVILVKTKSLASFTN